MPLYDVKEPLKHDGERLSLGDTVEMSAKAAAPLLKAGVIEAQAKPAAAKKAE